MAVGKRRAWQEHVAEALPRVLSTNSWGSLPAADAGAARAAGSEDAAAGHARPADEPTPEREAQAKRARGGSGAGMQPKQLFSMAAAEEAAAAGSRLGGLTGLEGGMLLEWAEMEVGAAETSGPPTEPLNPSSSPSNPSPSSPGISPRPGPEPTDRSAGMTTGHGIAAAAAAAREHDTGPVTSPPLRAGVRGCVPACERTTRGRSAEATQRRDTKRSNTVGEQEKRRRKEAHGQRKKRAKQAAQGGITSPDYVPPP